MVVDLLELTAGELAATAAARFGKGAGIARAVHRQATRAGCFAPESLGVSAATAARWRSFAHLSLPEVVDRQRESASIGVDVEKLVLRAGDGLDFECVRIPIGAQRENLCVSSQIGCRRACRFCETGRMGWLRDLRAAEIVAQVVVARRLGFRPRGIVFQGMGEPLDNFEALVRAIAVLTDRHGLGYAQERLTVCTAGNVDGIAALARQGWRRLNLAISLNAADDALRDTLMPINRRAPLAELQRALSAYRPRPNFTLGVHYCLLPGINDRRADARAVARFCAPLGRVQIALIPYNPGTAALTRTPTLVESERFVGWLRDEGLRVRRRLTKGRAVAAACGQLGDVGLRQRRAGALPDPR